MSISRQLRNYFSYRSVPGGLGVFGVGGGRFEENRPNRLSPAHFGLNRFSAAVAEPIGSPNRSACIGSRNRLGSGWELAGPIVSHLQTDKSRHLDFFGTSRGRLALGTDRCEFRSVAPMGSGT